MDALKDIIMVIDDDESVRIAINKILQREGYEIITAINGIEALNSCKKQQPSLIVLDMKMPGMDGVEFLEELKTISPQNVCPIIVLSGHASDDYIERCFEWGTIAFLTKPFNIYELRGMVKNILRLSKTEQALRNEIHERWEAEKKLRHNYRIQSVIASLLRKSLENIDIKDYLDEAINLIMSMPWLTFENKGAIFLTEGNPAELVLKAQRGLPDENIKQCERVPFGVCHCGLAALKQKIIFTNTTDDGHIIKYTGMSPHGHYCTPLVYNDKTLGVLNIYLRTGHSDDASEKEILSAVSNALASVIVRKRAEEQQQQSIERLNRNIKDVVEAMSHAVEAKDPYTAGHQRRVSLLAVRIAQKMELSDDVTDCIELAGIIHDLGKIAIPSEILSKPGQLNKIEFALIKTHSKVGYDILKDIEFPGPVAEIVLQHHERLNGTGYPAGLKADEILIEARIMCVADVVEAMAFHRPYRAALGVERAVEEITKNNGILYDPVVVAACIDVIKTGFKFD
ncbi:MAG: response regulator [Nitrospirae bacterium]|nr:response regulator [Nitrospirota bacterium]